MCLSGDVSDGNDILICEGEHEKNHGCHQKCCEPPLECVPNGPWYCPEYEVEWSSVSKSGHPTLITFPLQPQRPYLALALAPAPALAQAPTQALALALALALTQVLIVSLNQILITSGGSHSTPPKTQFHVPLGEILHTMYI